MCPSEVQRFYSGRSIFVTGATGFVGKVLVEKLLRSCPDVGCVYVLIRDKHGLHSHRRFQDWITGQVFDNLRNERPELLDKVTLISGDLSQPDLGISSLDLEMLRSRVSLVFHSAARVKFDRNVQSAVEVNIRGVRRIIDLCRHLPHLQAAVHVSTCFVRPDQKRLDEVIHPSVIDLEKIISQVDCNNEDLLSKLSQSLQNEGPYPDVYTLTKALGESVLETEGSGIPWVVIRPSIVTAALKEPMAGWSDNLNGPTGYVAGVSKGFLRVLRFDSSLIGDVIPVDLVVNLMVTAAWNRGLEPPDGIVVYNIGTGSSNPITWGQFHQRANQAVRQNPIERMIWYPDLAVRKNYWIHRFDVLVFHYLPAFLIDKVAHLTGRKSHLVQLYEKVHRFMSCLDFYATHQWHFETDRSRDLLRSMSPHDRQVFNFDVGAIDWNTYVRNYVLGIRHFIHGEDLDTLSRARKKQSILFRIRCCLRLLLVTIFALILRSALQRTPVSTFILSQLL